jgi:hypothetical protein
MDSNKSRTGALSGLGAAAAAFGVAALMSTATAPSAYADDFTDIINAVDGDFANGAADFNTAFGDFSGGDVTDGLPALLNGLGNDLISPGDSLYLGTIQALTNTAISPASVFDFDLPPLTTSALTGAEGYFSEGESYFAEAATDLSSGDYADAAYLDTAGFDIGFILPVDELLLGVAGSL